MMVIRFVSIVAILLLATSAAGQGHADVVYLRDGTTIRGTIIERVPGEFVRMRASDGSVYVCAMEDVLRMTVDGVEVTARTRPKPTGPRLSPTEATLTSLGGAIFTGLDGGGQWVNGEKVKALAFAATSIAAWSMVIQGADTRDDDMTRAGLQLRLLGYVFAAAEANWSARRINRRRGHTALLRRAANDLQVALNAPRRGRGGMVLFTHRM